jgi:uncharacterized protein
MPTVFRHITSKIIEALEMSPIVFLNGPRQSGKSTLVQNLPKSVSYNGLPSTYITFDRPTQMAAALASPEAFLTMHQGRLIIDEVQLVPELFRALKLVVDELRIARNNATINGKYLLTGSANILALPALSDALVGRMTVQTLYPFSCAEAGGGKGNGLEKLLAMDFTNVNPKVLSLVEAIRLASFPEISGKSTKIRTAWFDGYITTLLQRDVRQLAELEKIAILPNLLRVLATRAGGLINDSDISREVGLNSVTGKFYRHILKMLFLTIDIPPWHSNIGKRLVKASKSYLTDTLLLCYMLDVQLEELQKNKPSLFGHVLENFVATELVKLLASGNLRAKLLHFRTSDGQEVDFIIEKPDGRTFAIEIKTAESVQKDDFKNILAFAALNEKTFIGGVVLYGGKQVVPFGKQIWAVPISVLWV